MSLEVEIGRLEDVIADRRELYNDQVFRYNTRIGQLPAKLLAPLFGWSPAEFFASGGDGREQPPVDLHLT